MAPDPNDKPTAVVDLDGTLNAAPAELVIVLTGLRAQGWHIAVLTGCHDGIPFNAEGLATKARQVAACGLTDWDSIVLFDGDHEQVAEAKARWCEARGVRIAIDNAKVNARALVDAKVQLVLVPWATRT